MSQSSCQRDHCSICLSNLCHVILGSRIFQTSEGEHGKKSHPRPMTCDLKSIGCLCGFHFDGYTVVGIEQETERRSIVQNRKVFNIFDLRGKLRMSQQKTRDACSCHLPLQKIEEDPQTFKGELWCKLFLILLQSLLQRMIFPLPKLWIHF